MSSSLSSSPLGVSANEPSVDDLSKFIEKRMLVTRGETCKVVAELPYFSNSFSSVDLKFSKFNEEKKKGKEVEGYRNGNWAFYQGGLYYRANKKSDFLLVHKVEPVLSHLNDERMKHSCLQHVSQKMSSQPGNVTKSSSVTTTGTGNEESVQEFQRALGASIQAATTVIRDFFGWQMVVSECKEYAALVPLTFGSCLIFRSILDESSPGSRKKAMFVGCAFDPDVASDESVSGFIGSKFFYHYFNGSAHLHLFSLKDLSHFRFEVPRASTHELSNAAKAFLQVTESLGIGSERTSNAKTHQILGRVTWEKKTNELYGDFLDPNLKTSVDANDSLAGYSRQLICKLNH